MEQKGSKTGTASQIDVTVKKADFTNLKCLPTPPKAVVDTLTAVLYLLGRLFPPGRGWDEAKKFMASPTSLEEINNIDVSKVKPEDVAKAKEVLSEATVEKVRNGAMCASGLFCWVQAVIKASESHSAVTQ